MGRSCSCCAFMLTPPSSFAGGTSPSANLSFRARRTLWRSPRLSSPRRSGAPSRHRAQAPNESSHDSGIRRGLRRVPRRHGTARTSGLCRSDWSPATPPRAASAWAARRAAPACDRSAGRPVHHQCDFVWDHDHRCPQFGHSISSPLDVRSTVATGCRHCGHIRPLRFSVGLGGVMRQVVADPRGQVVADPRLTR